MKSPLFFRGIVITGWMSLMAWAAPAPDRLAFADLTDHIDRWPATVSVLVNVRTKSGQTALKGQRLRVANITDKAVFVQNAAGGLVGLSPEQCDVLEAANARWGKLTPAQRALDVDTVLKDSSLWPDTVRMAHPAKVTDAAGMSKVLPRGLPSLFLYYSNEDVGVVPSGLQERKWFKPDTVNLLEGARERLLLAPEKRPSKLIEAVRPLMRDAEGRPFVPPNLEQTKVFVFFWGANWCGWCHKLSPELAAFVNKNRPRHPELTVIMLDGDKEQSEMLKYLKEMNLPWPGIAMSDWQRLPFFAATHENSWPQLFISDRYGKILYNGGGGSPDDIAHHLEALNKALNSGG